TAAFTADLGEANAAHTPSPVCLNNQPPCASIAERNTSSWAASATRIPSASASHRRVEPSTSVNRNVTTPEGAGTSAECHNEPCFHTSQDDQTTDHEAGPGRPRRLRYRAQPPSSASCLSRLRVSAAMRPTWPTATRSAIYPQIPPGA